MLSAILTASKRAATRSCPVSPRVTTHPSTKTNTPVTAVITARSRHHTRVASASSVRGERVSSLFMHFYREVQVSRFRELLRDRLRVLGPDHLRTLDHRRNRLSRDRSRRQFGHSCCHTFAPRRTSAHAAYRSFGHAVPNRHKRGNLFHFRAAVYGPATDDVAAPAPTHTTRWNARNKAEAGQPGGAS